MLAQARYRAAGIQSFRQVLSAWLPTVPPAGWEGGVAELEDALEAVKAEFQLRGWIPRGTALGARMRAEAPFLEANGFTLAFYRTATARTIRVERSAG